MDIIHYNSSVLFGPNSKTTQKSYFSLLPSSLHQNLCHLFVWQAIYLKLVSHRPVDSPPNFKVDCRSNTKCFYPQLCTYNA